MKFRYWLSASCLLFGLFFCVGYIYTEVYPKPYTESIRRTGYPDENLIYAVIKTESSFEEQAFSASGAVGLMQIMPSTADFLVDIYRLKSGALTDPDYNIYIGIQYIRYLENKFENLTTVLAAYNAGEGNVSKWLADKNYSSDGKQLDFIPFIETKNYVKRVQKNYKFYNFFYKNT